MDRNSAIGLTLIAVLLLVYFNFFAPEPPKETPPVVTTEKVDSTARDKQPLDTASAPLNPAAAIEEKLTRVETNDLIISFSNHGGVIKEVELKNYKTYYQKPLYLATGASNAFRLNAILEGKDTDLYTLFYTGESRNISGVHPDTKLAADSTEVTFTTQLAEGKTIRHIYTVPSNGFQVKYRIETTGLDQSLNGEQLTFHWVDRIALQEKDMTNSRIKTTVNYYTAADDFDYLSEASQDPESENLTSPIKWISIKQKFFTSALIADRAFMGGEVATALDPADTSIVKTATVKLFIPKADVTANKAKFEYYFGPNQYELLSSVTNGFQKNLDLGWPPVSWVNRFVILPIFRFLETFISSYGIIILVLVIIIKLILTPLSYSSYLGMAKMRLLKPELDLIKEKNGDNATQAQQDQMKLYQQAGVNPLAGCIPLLLQMPILFAMFYFFPVSVEMRQQSFLWAEDLSTYDSILNLPFVIPFYGSHVSLFVLLMTISTLVSTWQNNQISSVTGPMKSMSYVMPVIFMFVLNSFSAGLSFYYFVSNVVGLAQQAIIRRFVDEDKIKQVMEDHKKKILSGGGSKSKFMTKLEEAMKASEEARKKKK